MKKYEDWKFLADCKNEDLKTLVPMMPHTLKGNLRFSEKLTNTDALEKESYNYKNSKTMEENKSKDITVNTSGVIDGMWGQLSPTLKDTVQEQEKRNNNH